MERTDGCPKELMAIGNWRCMLDSLSEVQMEPRDFFETSWCNRMKINNVPVKPKKEVAAVFVGRPGCLDVAADSNVNIIGAGVEAINTAENEGVAKLLRNALDAYNDPASPYYQKQQIIVTDGGIFYRGLKVSSGLCNKHGSMKCDLIVHVHTQEDTYAQRCTKTNTERDREAHRETEIKSALRRTDAHKKKSRRQFVL